MVNTNKGEPNTAPQPDRWYNLNLGNSFKDHRPSSKFCTLRYEFKPASIDKRQKGTLQKSKDNKVTVEFRNNQPGKPNVTFEGSSEDYKPNEAVLFFDGNSFRLERLHRAVKQLRHVRLPGESASSVAGAGAGGSAGPLAEAGGGVSPPVGKPVKAAYNRTPVPSVPVEVERIDIGGYKSPDAKPRNEKVVEYPPVYENALDVPPVYENALDASPDDKMDDLEEQLDIMIDDDDDVEIANGGNIEVKEFHSGIGIDINAPHLHDMDDEIAVDASDDEADMGRSAAEALKAKINAEGKVEQTSSSSSSGSESSSSSSSSSSDSENSDADSLTSI